MIIPKRAFGSLAFLCLTLTTSFAATELLYVQEGANILTYSVNNTTAVTTKLGTLKTNYNPNRADTRELGVTIQRSGSFLYLLGRSHSREYFTVYPLTAEGVPIANPVQTLSIKPQVIQAQFYIHPSGKFAYVMFSWSQFVHKDLDFASDIVLFTIDPTTGQLTNTTKVVAKFPLSKFHSISIYGMNREGTRLYTSIFPETGGGPFVIGYSYFVINGKTGALAKTNWMWSDTLTILGQQSVFSDALIARLENNLDGNSNINIYPNKIGVNQKSPLIKCTFTMLDYCGDSTDRPWIDPSGRYLFFDDDTIDDMEIVYINTEMKMLQASGASIPGIPTTIAFSPSGLLVFAVEYNEVLVYVFHNGKLLATSTIKTPDLIQILPAK